MPLSLELTDREIQLLVESIRVNEKLSRKAFGQWLATNMDVCGGELWTTKCNRASAVYAEFVALRARLGDNKPIKLD